jgi:hypothetical protein
MKIHPFAGKVAPKSMLANIPRRLAMKTYLLNNICKL